MRGIYLYKHFGHSDKSTLSYIYELGGIEHPKKYLHRVSKKQNGKCWVVVLSKEWLENAKPKIEALIEKRRQKQHYLIDTLYWVKLGNRLIDLCVNFDKYAEEIQ